MDQHPTGTVTFLFTDIEGSTKLAREHPETWEVARSRHHQILREAIESYSGYIFQVIGDAFCAAFWKAGEALHAAVSAQQELQKQTWGDCIIRVRMGIHMGEAELRENEYRGYLTLSLVQRIMSAGHGGQILVSDMVRESLHGVLPQYIDLQDRGKLQFKGFPELLRVFQVLARNLPTSFPPLKALNIRPTNLPIQLTSFVGREKELADVKRLLQGSPMLTLIGPGGTGKTRLSIHAGSELLDGYLDGVWLVELAPILDPAFVSRTMAITLGLLDEPQRPVIDMLCDYLRDKKILILLDNCEHLVDACARMADKILRVAPDVRFLATSREALGIGGEVTYRVPSLGLPDLDHLPSLESLSQYEAVKLFIDRATAVTPSFTVTNINAPVLAQICHHLDGIPLAIELAAAKVHVLSLEQISKRLHDRFRLLTGGSRTVLERHQTLRAAIDWSYNLLPTTEQILFRRLSVFVGGWTLEASELVCADELIDEAEILEMLGQLINKSMVLMEETDGKTRYRMLETMRQYANEKLVEVGESDILRDRHLACFLNLAETAEPHLTRPEQLQWLAKLDGDYENLRFALEWALHKEAAELSLRLCAALGWFWTVRGYWMEGVRWLHSALCKPNQSTQSENIYRVKALYQEAALANELDDLQLIKNSAEQSLALAETVSERRDIAIARSYLGWALDRQGDYEAAIALMQQSLADFQGMNEFYWESIVYNWIGSRLVAQGKLKVEEKVNHHLELARKSGERKNLGEALLQRAYQLFRFSQFDEARQDAEEANILFREIGQHVVETGLFFAAMAWLKGDLEEARAILLETRERFESLGDRSFRSLILAFLGEIAIEEGKLDRAQRYLTDALAVARELGDQDAITSRLAELGTASYSEQNMKDFKQHYRESFTLALELSSFRKRYILIYVLYSINSRKPEKTAQILGAISRSEEESTRPVNPLWKRYCYLAEANTRYVLGDATFQSAFTEGRRMSIDEAFELARKTVEEM